MRTPGGETAEPDLPAPERSASALAMDSFVANSPGLREPRIAMTIPGMPTLPELKALAQTRGAQGLPVIDQSAGDIADVGEPMSREFNLAYQYSMVNRGSLPPSSQLSKGLYHPFPDNYQSEYPELIEELGRSWGLENTPVKGCSTVSGRMAIDLALRGLKARLQPGQKGCIIMDPLAWPGYKPLAKELGLEIIHAPAVTGNGLSLSGEGLQEALQFAAKQGLTPVGIVPIVPSNPTGESMPYDQLKLLAETAAAANTPLMIDAFYSPLHREGHRAAVPLGQLEKDLSPEVLGNIGMIVGETKVISSQKKTGDMIWLAPQGHDELATHMAKVATQRKMAVNAYARPDEVLAALALHRFPGGIHAAMGPRYQALNRCRGEMREAIDGLGLPLTMGDSFYGTVGLIDPETGLSIVRNADGSVIRDPIKVQKHLVDTHGLIGAAGADFSSAPEAANMLRLTAAVKSDSVRELKRVLGEMIEHARKHS